MKKQIIMAGVAAVMTLGSALAQNVVWVQNANFALTAQVQVSDGKAQKFAINSKTLIQYLKGATNTGIETVTQTITNGTIVVTNDVRLPAGTNAGLAFTLTNYAVVVNGVTYTNTEPLDFSLISSDPVTYTFPNAINVPTSVTGFDTNATGFLFTDAALSNATDIIAIQNTNVDTNVTVFTVIGTSTSATEMLVTNVVPAQFASKTQRLIVKSLPDTETFFFFIRDGSTKSFVDYDVTTFFHYAQIAKVTQNKGTGFNDFLDLSIDLSGDVAGTGFQTEANGKQVRGTVSGAEGIFVRSLSATCVGSGTAATPIVSPAKALPAGPMVLSGKFTVNGGKIESSALQ